MKSKNMFHIASMLAKPRSAAFFEQGGTKEHFLLAKITSRRRPSASGFPKALQVPYLATGVRSRMYIIEQGNIVMTPPKRLLERARLMQVFLALQCRNRSGAAAEAEGVAWSRGACRCMLCDPGTALGTWAVLWDEGIVRCSGAELKSENVLRQPLQGSLKRRWASL